MIIGDLRNIALAAVLGLVVGATGSGLLVKRYVDNAWTAKVEKQKTEAATQLQAATDRAIKAERAHTAIATELEVQNEIGKQKLDDAYRDNRALSTQLGGLRDPGRRPSGSCPAGATTGSAQQPVGETTGTALSAEASDFLLDFAKQADDAAQYANTCYDWLQRLKGLKHVD
jgi:hypothetical protein